MLKIDRQELVKSLRRMADAIENAPQEKMPKHDEIYIGGGMVEFRRPHPSDSLCSCRVQIDFMSPSGTAGEAAGAAIAALSLFYLPYSEGGLDYDYLRPMPEEN